MKYPIKQAYKILDMLIRLYEQIEYLSDEHTKSIFLSDIDFNLIQDLVTQLNNDDISYFIKINNQYVSDDLSKIISIFLNMNQESSIEIIINTKYLNDHEIEISYK